MKFTVMFKTPDAIDEALVDVPGADHSVAKRLARKFVEYGEYVYIEFDTVKGTAKVLPAQE